MALVDAEYNFIYVDIGSQGGVSDGGVFKNCTLYKNMEKKKLNLPMPSTLPNLTIEVPYVFVGDQAFALSENIMKPYSGIHPKGSSERIFNYRLSRARRVSENAFGILSAVFRVLRKPLLLEPKKAELVVLTTICLHNFLRRSPSSRNIYAPDGFFDKEDDGRLIEGSWRHENGANATGLQQLKKIPRKSSVLANQIRDVFAEYFSTTEAVSYCIVQ